MASFIANYLAVGWFVAAIAIAAMHDDIMRDIRNEDVFYGASAYLTFVLIVCLAWWVFVLAPAYYTIDHLRKKWR